MKPSSEIHRIDNIHIELPVQLILRRLGYDKNDTPDASTDNLIRKNVAMALSLSECFGAFRILKIESIKNNEVLIENKQKIKSLHIAKFLNGCNFAVMMFATAGQKIVDEIENNIHSDKITEALILDAAASEIAEAAIEEVQNAVSAFVKKSALKMKCARFSPGYGDFTLNNQKLFFTNLNMENCGLKLSKTYQIIPEKTVTALSGLQ